MFLLWLADMACMAGVWFAIVKAYHALGFGRYVLADYLNAWPILLEATFLNILFKLYHGNWLYPSVPLSPVEEFRRLTGSLLITHASVMTVLGFAHQEESISRFVLAASCLVSILLAQSVRNGMRRLMLWCRIGQIPVALVGSGAAAEHTARLILSSTYLGLKIVGTFDHRGVEIAGLERLGSLKDIVPVCRKLGIKIMIACEDERLFREQLRDFTGHFQHIEYLPPGETFPVFGARAVSLEGVGGLEMVNQGRMKLLRLEREVLDKSLAILLFVVALPLFVIVPVVIKLTSRGPVFYRHHRLGRGGRPFKVWKFRSMYSDADQRLEELLAADPACAKEWKEKFKLAKDPRITPFGRFLRKTSIDELPQLFNVFMGEMALIGPRPIVESEVPHYGTVYDIVASVKPGITGLWQACGRSNTSYERRVALDVEYILNWNPWMDLWIILRTALSVLAMKGSC